MPGGAGGSPAKLNQSGIQGQLRLHQCHHESAVGPEGRPYIERGRAGDLAQADQQRHQEDIGHDPRADMTDRPGEELVLVPARRARHAAVEDNETGKIHERQYHDTEQDRGRDQRLTVAGQGRTGLGQGDGVADPPHLEADKRQHQRHGQEYDGGDRIGQPALDRQPVATYQHVTAARAVRPLVRPQGRQRDHAIAVGAGTQAPAEGPIGRTTDSLSGRPVVAGAVGFMKRHGSKHTRP